MHFSEIEIRFLYCIFVKSKKFFCTVGRFVFGNDLAQKNPDKAHAILTDNAKDQSYLVSIRAPISNRKGADTLALQFDTGGGRSAAAGINRLPYAELDIFIQAFRKSF